MKRTNHVFLVGNHAFVKHPTIRGAWLRTDSSVFLVACDYCKAAKGALCRGATPGTVNSSTHSARRHDAAQWRKRQKRRGKAPVMVHSDLR